MTRCSGCCSTDFPIALELESTAVAGLRLYTPTCWTATINDDCLLPTLPKSPTWQPSGLHLLEFHASLSLGLPSPSSSQVVHQGQSQSLFALSASLSVQHLVVVALSPAASFLFFFPSHSPSSCTSTCKNSVASWPWSLGQLIKYLPSSVYL